MAQNIGEHDVLMGRGGATNNNPGNIKFREIVSSKQLVYLDAKKKEKKTIAEECVETVRKNGGRFLKRDDASGSWVAVPVVQAVKKASQALREGLDVRHKRLREGKSGLIMSEPDKRKRQKVVTGKVVSPALISLPGDENAVPELKDEMPAAQTAVAAAAAEATTYFARPLVSTNDCKQVMQI